jgi:glycosyltransferase involved in cell wall biosynthesis
MKVLVISDRYPMPDRGSGDFRLVNLLNLLSSRHRVDLVVTGEARQAQVIGPDAIEQYRQCLERSGVRVLRDGVPSALRSGTYDCVVFEWYFTADGFIDDVREWQPGARVVVDAVDVVFNRMQSKARLTQTAADQRRAAEIRRCELEIYRRADLVFTVSDADADILRREVPDVLTRTVPNIHPLREARTVSRGAFQSLVFIGSFTHEPNVDAVRYFCGEVLPLIAEAVPDVKFRIIGNAPTAEVIELVSEYVEVLGYVPDTAPFLSIASVAVAPLRFGGGMKGKLGEAMSFGVPVVTTSVGIEGFGLTPGEHVLVGDDPRAFADAVVRLLRDDDLSRGVGMSGYRFICENYSDRALRPKVQAVFAELQHWPIKQIPWVKLALRKQRAFWRRHIAWRLER